MPTDTSQQIAALESRLATLEEATQLFAQELNKAKEREESNKTQMREELNEVKENAITADALYVRLGKAGPDLHGSGQNRIQLDVSGRARVRQADSHSAGIWFFQSTPSADQAFVGMASDNQIGFWGTALNAFGLAMDTTNGDVSVAGEVIPKLLRTVCVANNSITEPLYILGGAPGVRFVSDVHVEGKLTKSSGSFRIDHPLDPANRYLSHSFVESPEMLNVYSGTLTTDDGGEAVVILPDYFEALNCAFRYQLTVIGQFAQAIVAREIEGNRFTVKSDKSHIKVSWQVTGVRQDVYANAYPIIVEEDKPEHECGLYLHPELYCQPESRSVFQSAPRK